MNVDKVETVTPDSGTVKRTAIFHTNNCSLDFDNTHDPSVSYVDVSAAVVDGDTLWTVTAPPGSVAACGHIGPQNPFDLVGFYEMSFSLTVQRLQ